MTDTLDPPAACHAALFRGVGRPIDIESFPLPVPSAREAIVRIECCTLCGSDLHSVTGARHVPVPSILGHEAIGTIVSVGKPAPLDIDGHPVGIGERVTWSVSVSCMQCDRCRRGLPQKCRKLIKYGHEPADGRNALNGGLAEFLVLQPGSTIICVPDGILQEAICPANCATATVAAAMRQAGNISGRRVLIFGAGMLGLTAAAMVRAREPASIAICDLNPQRLKLAKSFGADAVFVWHEARDAFLTASASAVGDSEFDVIFEFSGAAAAVERACDVSSIGASIVLAGTVMPSRQVNLDPEQIVRRCLSISGVHNYAPKDLQTAVSFLADNHNRYPFAELVSRSYSLSDVDSAFRLAIEHRPIRIAIRP